MDSPHNKLSVIHVAGTNGKGSNCAYLQHILTEAGYKTGTFTSPHLLRYNERMCINKIPISNDDFARILTYVVKISEEMSFFEILTCMAFKYFSENAVDIAIIETGIGGRLDSTNVIDQPLLSVITAPGYDHQELLGHTLKEIAAEDAGIIKKNCPAAVYPTPVYDVFKNADDLYYIGDDMEVSVNYSLESTTFSVKTAYFSYQSLSIQLLGEHQLQNAIHAILCIEALRRSRGMNISEESLRKGLFKCQWPGRFEIVSKKPYIVLDGAHNEDSAKIFKEAMLMYFPNKRKVLLVGISNGKDYKKILNHLIQGADTVICTCSNFRPMDAITLTEYVKQQTKAAVIAESNCHKALKLAKEQAGTDGVVAAAGSLYLIANLKECDSL